MSKKKQLPMYIIIVEAIKENETFSIKRDNESGFKTIAEMVTFYLLRNYSECDRLKLFSGLLPQVKRSFPKAMEYLETNGIPIYKYTQEGKRNLEFITTKSKYRKAQDRDTTRGANQTKAKIIKFVKHVKKVNPNALPQIKQKLLKGKYLEQIS